MIEKHSVTLAGHRTSVSLEAPFWAALREIAATRGESVTTIIRRLDEARPKDGGGYNLSGAIRVFVLQELQAALADATRP